MKKPVVTGTLRITRGRTKRLVVVDAQGRSFRVMPKQDFPVFPGDTVKAELSVPPWLHKHRGPRPGRRGGPPQGGTMRPPPMDARILEVVERGRGMLLGRYRFTANRAWVVPRETDVLPPLEVTPKPGVPEGAMVAVDVGQSPGVVSGDVVHVWIDPDAPRARIEQLIYERDLPREFPAAVVAEAEAAPGAIPADEIGRRTDLRNLEIVVIDPADAKDHDDAVSWEPNPAGGGRLGVHIADVSWYVRPGSALDDEARARGVSCYLTDRVIPMLPMRLSADLCSLIAGKDRLARTVFIEYDAEGNVVRGEHRQSVIRAAVSLSYPEALAIMQDPASAHPNATAIHGMAGLAAILRKRRFAAGCLDFSFPETRVHLGPDGEPEKIVQRLGDPSHWLIEEFMIAANTWTGEQLARRGTGIWRVHEPPAMEDIGDLEEFLKGLNVKLRRGASSRDLHPADFQAVLERFRGTPEEYVVHRKVLQALRLAVYSAECLGHFGLALKTYTHFTSPIRRYADLVVHRLLNPLGPEGRQTMRHLEEVALTTSELERRAQEAEWACTKMMVLRFMEKHLGDVWEGTVARVERFGAFVELDGIGQSGLLSVDELGAERYWVSRDGLSMRGSRSGETIKVGQRVKVVIARINREDGHLDLMPAE